MKTLEGSSAQWMGFAKARQDQLEERLRAKNYPPLSRFEKKKLETFVEPGELIRGAPYNAWLNGAQRMLAERRVIDAQIVRAPYVVATMKVGEQNLAFDASMSHQALSYTNELRSKMYSAEGIEWVHSGNSMNFFAYLFESKQWVNLGDYQSLFQAGLGQHTVRQLLDVSGLLERYCGENVSYILPHHMEEQTIKSKLSYWALLMSGILGPKQDQLAAKSLEGIGASDLRETMLEEIAYSAVHDQFLMSVALSNGIDVNRKSEKLGCYPATWAALKGAREAAEKLLARSPGAAPEFNL